MEIICFTVPYNAVFSNMEDQSPDPRKRNVGDASLPLGEDATEGELGEFSTKERVTLSIP